MNYEDNELVDPDWNKSIDREPLRRLLNKVQLLRTRLVRIKIFANETEGIKGYVGPLELQKQLLTDFINHLLLEIYTKKGTNESKISIPANSDSIGI